MIAATLLALGAAVLHAGWNLAAKQSGDRFLALWAQFAVAGAIGWVALGGWWIVAAATDGTVPQVAWWWAVASGAVHLPYLLLLAAAYDRGDFSVSYPIARGGGAVIAAVGGVVLLGDHLSATSALGIALASSGLVVLGLGVTRSAVTRPAVTRSADAAPEGGPVTARLASSLGIPALVAVSIGAYTLIDSAGSRRSGAGAAYALAVFAFIGTACAAWAMARGRARDVSRWVRAAPTRAAATGAAALVTYGMVLVAVQRAPVGYVTALRESSVVIAAFAGWRFLDEGDHRRRLVSSAVVTIGLVLLVTGA